MEKYEKYDKDKLIKHILELEKQLLSTKYGLYWDKDIDIEFSTKKMMNNIPIFKNITENNVSNNGLNNLLIEGDNLHALTALNMAQTGDGLVDVIYIDPPYNTGNKDFKYNDKFVEKTDGFYHSKWLNFMKHRLKLMRDLLKETGIIFISIDDNELYNLKLLCDSIFGSECFLGNIIQEKGNAQNDAVDIQKNHEYCLVYCKKRLYRLIGTKKKEISHIFVNKKNDYECYIEDDRFYYIGSGITTGGEGGTLNARANLGYTIYYNEESGHFIGVDDYDHKLALTSNDEKIVYSDSEELIKQGYKKIRPPMKKGKLGVWTWSIDNFNQNLDKIIIRKSKNGYSVNKKEFVDKENIVEENGKYFYRKTVQSPINSVVKFSSSQGSSELRNILKIQDFNNPKNVEYIQYLISTFANKDAVVLDCFAGSGTTGQAVLELNQLDEGKRRFILCTNNENNICKDVTYPRLKTVISGSRPDGSRYSSGIPANLHYFECDFIKNTGNSDQIKYNLVERINNLICINENCFDLIEKKSKYFIYENANTKKRVFLYVDYFDDISFVEFRKKITDSMVEEKVIYVFSTDNVVDTSLFLGVKNISVKAIPSKIYEIYKEVIEDIKRG